MLSRTAASLYWIGRYMERAEFTTRLVEATIRLAALGGHAHVEQAWLSALSVVRAPPLDVSREGLGARRFLTLSMTIQARSAHPSSPRATMPAPRAPRSPAKSGKRSTAPG